MEELSDISWMIQQAKIIDTIVGVANAIDDKNWQKLRVHLANKIDIDYFEFRGEPPGQITAEEYIQQRVSGLTGLKTLQHESTYPNREELRQEFPELEKEDIQQALIFASSYLSVCSG